MIHAHCPDVEPLHDKGSNQGNIITINSDDDTTGQNGQSGNNGKKQVLQCLDRLYHFKIDQQPVDNEPFSFHTHPRNEVPGMVTYLPLKTLAPGKHTLRVRNPESNYRFSFYYHPE